MRTILLTVLVMSVAVPAVMSQEKQVHRVEMDDATKRATAKALEWLKSKQNDNGSFSDAQYSHNTAITAYAMLAFMSQGHLPEHGKYGPEVARAARFLVAAQREQDGYIVGARGGNMYCHAFATMALAEIYGRTGDEKLKPVVEKATKLIVTCQSPQGGWRYEPRPFGADISITVTQVMALRTAKRAGIEVPDATMTKAVAYVKSCRYRTGGFSYMPNSSAAGFARTAAGLCVLYPVEGMENKEFSRDIEYLKNQFDAYSHFYYGHYYAAQVMHQVGGKEWADWYARVVKHFLAKQNADGFFFHTRPEVGPVYQTSIAVLCLTTPETFPKKFNLKLEKKEVVEKPIRSPGDFAERLESLAKEQFSLHLRSARAAQELIEYNKPDLSPTVRLFLSRTLLKQGKEMRRQYDAQIDLDKDFTFLVKRMMETSPKWIANEQRRVKAMDDLFEKARLHEGMIDTAGKLRTLGLAEVRVKAFGVASAQQRQLAHHLQDASTILQGNADDLVAARSGIAKAIAAQKELTGEIRSHLASSRAVKEIPKKKGDDKLTLPGLDPLPKITPPKGKSDDVAIILQATIAERSITLAEKQARLAFEFRLVIGRAEARAPGAAQSLKNAEKAMNEVIDRLRGNDLPKAVESAGTTGDSLERALNQLDRVIADGKVEPAKNKK